MTLLSLEKRMKISPFLHMLAPQAFLKPSFSFGVTALVLFVSNREGAYGPVPVSRAIQRNVSSPSETSNVYFPFVGPTNSEPGCQGRSPPLAPLQWEAYSLARASEGNSPVFLMPVASLKLKSW